METLILEDKSLRELPLSVAEQLQGSQTLRKLSLKDNLLTTLPHIFATIPNLYYLNLSGNQFERLPLAVCECPGLEILDVSGNQIRDLPRQLCRLTSLKVLSLSRNQIRYLSPTLADLPNLMIVEADGNPLVMPPPEILAEDDFGRLQEYLREHRQELLAAELPTRMNSLGALGTGSTAGDSEPARSRSASEGWLSVRQAKRMGFVMQKNASGSSYVASLHARGLSHDGALLRNEDQPGVPATPAPSGAPIPGPPPTQDIGPEPTTPTDISSHTPQDTPPRLHPLEEEAPEGEEEEVDHSLYSLRSFADAVQGRPLTLDPRLRSLVSDGSLYSAAEAADILSKPENVSRIVRDRRSVRRIVAGLIPAIAELQALNTHLTGSNAPGVPTEIEQPEMWLDGQLYAQLEEATRVAQAVVSLLNSAIARSATAVAVAQSDNPDPTLTARVRELTSTCLTGTTSTKKVRALLDVRRTAGSQAVDRRKFWDEVNAFLKAIISILGAIKTAMPVVPLLADATVGSEVSSLARVAKEIPPLLEQSSYKLLIPGSTPTPGVPPTPLTASLGAAAAVLSPYAE